MPPLPAPFRPPAPSVAGSRDVNGPGAGPGRTGRMGRGRSAVAAVVVVALLAVVGLVAWRRHAAGDAGRSRRHAAAAPTSGTRRPRRSADAGLGGSRHRLPGRARRLLHPAGRLEAVRRQPGHECATIEVPVDYAKPGGDRFTLALRKGPATDAVQAGRLAAHQPRRPRWVRGAVRPALGFAFSPAVRAAYDIVGFDPRGIGQSSPVRCLTDDDMDQLFSVDPTPDSAAERAELLSEADRDHRASARSAAGSGRGTSARTEVARDMDVMRVLVGDRKLNFFGGSYGTFLGAIYADTFPTKVGRMVLDSAMSPNQTDEQEMSYDIQGFESSIDAFIDWCVARPDCALGLRQGSRPRQDRRPARRRRARRLDDEQARARAHRRGLGRLLDLHVPLLVAVVADAQQGSRPGLHRQGRHPARQGDVGRRAQRSRAVRRLDLPAGDAAGALRRLAAVSRRRRRSRPPGTRPGPTTRCGPG